MFLPPAYVKKNVPSVPESMSGPEIIGLTSLVFTCVYLLVLWSPYFEETGEKKVHIPLVRKPSLARKIVR